jgi:hypothetical protein
MKECLKLVSRNRILRTRKYPGLTATKNGAKTKEQKAQERKDRLQEFYNKLGRQFRGEGYRTKGGYGEVHSTHLSPVTHLEEKELRDARKAINNQRARLKR